MSDINDTNNVTARTPQEIEDIIYGDDTVTLVIDALSQGDASFRDNPDIIASKTMIGGFDVLYTNKTVADSLLEQYKLSLNSVFPSILALQASNNAADSSGVSQVWYHPELGLRGDGVLIGFVDTGIDFTLPCFMKEDGTTKIRRIWDQSVRGNPPSGFLYGTEYTNEDIDKALKTVNPKSSLDHMDSVGHGTFLASVAAGSKVDNESSGIAPNAEIVVVKLKKASQVNLERYYIDKDNPNPLYSSDDVAQGMQYLIDKAIELKMPISVCLALGSNEGGHDGTSAIEKFMARFASIEGTAVCLAAGNEAQAGHHTQGKLDATGDSKIIEFKASDIYENIRVNIWNSALDRLSISVKSPTGETITRLQAQGGSQYKRKLVLERATVIVEYYFPVENNGGQRTQVTILSATPGVWTITVYGDTIVDGVYHAWLPVTGILDPSTQFLEPVPTCTIVTPGNTIGAITCGGYNPVDNSMYIRSSEGPSRFPINLPDLVAPAVDIAGYYPYGLGTMTGTSVAAAITTGACALILQWGGVDKNDPAIESYRMRAYLLGGCDREKNITYPNVQWGYGRLNLFNTFKSLRPI